MVSAHSHTLPRRVIKIAFNIYGDDSHASIIPREFSIRDSIESYSQWKSFTFKGLRVDIFQYLMGLHMWDYQKGRS